MHPWGSRSPGSPRTIAVVHHPLVPVGGRGAAIDASDAELFNRAFARDVLWRSPFGAVVGGYDEIHSIHLKMIAAASARQVQGDVATCGRGGLGRRRRCRTSVRIRRDQRPRPRLRE